MNAMYKKIAWGLFMVILFNTGQTQPKAPNFLFLMAEDINTHLGCYGETLVHTPNIDRLAAQGVKYTKAFTVSGVCAPSRAAIITGMYSTSIGTQHMRQAKSLTPYDGIPFYNAVPPPYVKAFTEYLRAAGYFCTNTNKTDYQFGQPFTVWDSHHPNGHWRDNPHKDQPFFSCFTFETTHEINVWPDSTKWRFFREFGVDTARLMRDVKRRPVIDEKYIIDPLAVVLPPYYPEDPVVRQDYARHLTNISRMDTQVGAILRQLEEDGKADNTIIFFMGDNGDGIPRSKRWMNDGGIHVPLIVYVPPALRSQYQGKLSGVDEQLISFIDLAPTVLSLAGIQPPGYMHGQHFVGKHKLPSKRKYVFAGRDRMDNRYDLQRAIRSKKYKYIRNYWPDTAYNPPLDFMYQAPIMRRIDSLYRAGELSDVQAAWLADSKPEEELYDLENDPHEINNLANIAKYANIKKGLANELKAWQHKYGDWFDTPEIIQAEKMWPGGKQPVTDVPSVEFEGDKIRLICNTEGASIAYKTDVNSFWKLYTKPFALNKGDTMVAKAVRYGFQESALITIKM